MKKEVENLNDYERKILLVWEEVYKKGQLTFWILLSLRVRNQYMQSIKKFIEKSTNGTLEADDKSMYRALRRLVQMDLIFYKDEPSPQSGPSRKSYFLTDAGEKVLQAFINRNITGIFFKPELIKLLKGTK